MHVTLARRGVLSNPCDWRALLLLFFFAIVAACARSASAQSAFVDPPGQDVERQLHADLQAALAETRALLGRTGVDSARDPIAGLRAAVDRIRAADLLLTAQAPEQERHLLDHAVPASVVDRAQRMAAMYRREFDQLYALVEPIVASRGGQDPAALRPALEALAEYLDRQIEPLSRTPLAQTLAYRTLDLPQKTPQLGAAIVPAYLLPDPPAPTAADSAATAEAPFSADLRSRAGDLAQDPIAIFEFVQNQIATEFYYGAMKGAGETLREKGGNDIDQASLLVALLRASGTAARYVRGVAVLTSDQAMRWTGVSTAGRAAQVLTRAGIPFNAVPQGGTIGSFEIEHLWVEAFVPYSNYRGVLLETTGKIWVPLDPSFKFVITTPGIDPATMNFKADTLVSGYLAAPQTLTPLEFYKKHVADFLAQSNQGTTFDQAITRRSIQAASAGLLPSTLPYRTLSINQEFAELPESLRHHVRFIAQADGGVGFDLTLAASALVGRRVTLSYVPATVEDQITAGSYLGIENTPAYLLKLRPVLKVGGEIRGGGEASVQMGTLHELAIEIQSPDRTVRVANQVLAGSFYAIALGARQPAFEPSTVLAPGDTENQTADLLYSIGAGYLQQWDDADRDVADILGVTRVTPMLAEVMIGSAYNRTLVFGQPHAIDWRGVFIDADLRFAEAVPIGSNDALGPDFMRLSGLAGSMLEGDVLEKRLESDAVSAAKLIQLAHAAGVPVDEIDSSNIAAKLPLLQTADVVKTDISDAVRQGRRAIVPRTDFTRNIWTGIGYILLDPDTGSAGYFISGSLAGGQTTTDPAEWVQQQFVAELGHPYQERPNTDATAVFSIRKVVVTDHQDGKAGQPIERPIAVWVRDSQGRPVQGADVTFTVVAGGGLFGQTATFTVLSDYLGIARAKPALGKHTIDSPFYVKKQGDTFVTRIGQNIVTAKARGSGGDIPLDEPFQLFAYPGPPKAIVKLLGDGTVGLPASAAGTILGRLEDEFDNAVANVDLTFKVQPAEAFSGTLPTDADPMVIYPREPACATANPILGQCGGVSELTVKASIFGVGVEAILGDTEATKFRVSLAAAAASGVPAQTFSLFSTGDRAFGSGTYRRPAVTLSRMVFVNDKGQTLDAAKVGTAFPDPLGIVARIIEDNYILEPTSQPCPSGPSDPPCVRIKSLETVRVRAVDDHLPGDIFFSDTMLDAIQADKSQETATVTFTPTSGGGATAPVTTKPGGQYSSRLTVGAAPDVNKVEVDATAHVWVPYLDVRHGTATPLLADLKPGQLLSFDTSVSPPLPIGSGQAIKLTFDVFGVRASIKQDTNLLIGRAGGTVKDFKLDYLIEPATYNAFQADVDLFTVNPQAAQDDWLGLLIGDKKAGEGAGTIFQGTFFDPSKRYKSQLVLNRGGAVQIASDKRTLDAYFAAPLGSDFRARENTFEQVGRKKTSDLAQPLRDERATLVSAIQQGMIDAQSCAPLINQLGISMLEQGSGSCFWKPEFDTDPVSACGAFHPKTSDHDYEVFIPSGSGGLPLSGATCVIEKLTKAAKNQEDLGDLTFFYLPKEELAAALLNLNLPPVPVGDDPLGDMALGRQTLLLSKILLEGEYVRGISGVNDPAKTLALDTILEKLRTTPNITGEPTGVPRLEGYEQAILQEFAFYKSRAHLRMTGPGVDPKSYLYDLAQSEVRGAAKAAIRAALGRLVADADGNKLLFVSRQEYRTNGCLTGAMDPSHPPPLAQLFAKSCQTFEEHVASTAVKAFRQNLGIFTEDQVKQIYQFYRMKAEPPCAAAGCQTQIVDEKEANAFVASAVKFIQEVNAATIGVWSATKGSDTPARAIKRDENVARAIDKTLTEAKPIVTRVLEDHLFNEVGVIFKDVPLHLFSNGTPEVDHVVSEIKPPELIIDVRRDASGRPIKDPTTGKLQPIFTTKFPSDANRLLSIMLDPGNGIRECNKRDNFSGFFTYPLNPNDPTVPNFGDLPPPVPLPTPPPECAENPIPELKLTKLVNGQPNIVVAPFTKLAISHRIKNTGAVPVTGVVVTDQLTNKTYGPFVIPPGITHRIDDTFESRVLGKEIVGPSQVIGFGPKGIATAWDSVVLNLVRPPCSFAVALLKDDPNPYAEKPPNPPPAGQPTPFPEGTAVSTVMTGGRAYRYYRVVDGGTGEGIAGARVTIRINGQLRDVLADEKGFIVHQSTGEGDDPKGLEILASSLPGAGRYRVEFVAVNDSPALCSEPFWFEVVPFTFNRSLKSGTSVKLEGAYATLSVNAKTGYGVKLGMKSTPTSNTEASFGRDVNAEVGVGFKPTAAKGRVKFIGEASLGSLGGQIGISGSLSLTDSYKFGLPLDRPKALGLGQLLISTEVMAASSTTLGSPHLGFVITQLFERLAFTNLDQFRSSYGASTALTVSAGFQASLPKLTFKRTPIPQLQNFGIGIGIEGSASAAVTASFTVAPIEQEFTTGVEYRAGASISGGLDIGKERLAPVIVSEGGQDELQFLLTTIDKIKFRLSGGIAGSVAFKTAIDTSKSPLELKQVQVSLSAQKNWGLTLPVLQDVAGSGEAGKTNTFEFTVKDPAKLDKAVEKITLIQVLTPVAAVTPIAGPLLGPVLIGDQIAELITLFDDYKEGVERGTASELGIGLSGFLEGTGLEGDVALKFDTSVEFDTEKGSVRKGKQYKLERYDENDSRLPSATETTAVPRAFLEEVFGFVKQELLNAYTTLTTSIIPNIASGISLISQRLSPAGVDLKINNAAEPAPFDVSLLAYKYLPVAGPVRSEITNPADTSGPADLPHNGIGGFFQFFPERKVLAAPAELTILYEDHEVASLDESALAIYKWDPARLEWSFVGGTPDPAANTVKANVTTLGLYTVAPRMPAGRFTFAHQSAPGGTVENPQTTVQYTSSQIRLNSGVIVPDGTRFTVKALIPEASEQISAGEITTADEDPLTDGVQVTTQGGVIRFAAKYPGSSGAVHVVAFPVAGTALSEQVISYP